MAKRHEIAEALKASVRWPPELRQGAVLDATVGWLRLQIGDRALTHYRTDNGQEGDEIQIPLYDVAEWIALNWWPLFSEPKKSDQAEQDPDFRSRHWLGIARNGFALPDAWLIPVGGKIEVAAFECYLRATRLRFTESVHVAMSLADVRDPLASLLDEVSQRLSAADIEDTPFQDAWRQIKETAAETEEFCHLMGSLGLSPYEEHPDLEALLDRLTAELPSSLVRDLCEALDAATLLRAAPTAARVWEAVAHAPQLDISRLSACPPDATTDRAAMWGLEAAWRARKAIGVSRADPAGGDEFFKALGLSPEVDTVPLVDGANRPADELAGAVARADSSMRVALMRDPEIPRRRFAGARAAFLAWSARNHSSRLLTDGRTRDQQASRAFAAEILAPISYIRSKAYNRTLPSYQVGALARELGVSTAVIENQARSHRLFLAAS
jgi:hypothetical protein